MFIANDGKIVAKKDSSTSVVGETPEDAPVNVNIEVQFKQMLAMFQGGGGAAGANIAGMLGGGNSSSMDR